MKAWYGASVLVSLTSVLCANFKLRAEQGVVTAMRQTLGLLFGGPNITISD